MKHPPERKALLKVQHARIVRIEFLQASQQPGMLNDAGYIHGQMLGGRCRSGSERHIGLPRVSGTPLDQLICLSQAEGRREWVFQECPEEAGHLVRSQLAADLAVPGPR